MRGTPEATKELIRWMRGSGFSREETAEIVGRSVRTVSRVANRRKCLTNKQIALIRLLRSEGYTLDYVAFRVGVSASTVRKIAPGRPGKVPVAPLREAFLALDISPAEVARRLGWMSKGAPDGSRVKRTLGIVPDTTHKAGSVRTWVDAETVMRIAEVIGVSPWSVLPEEEV